mmetsp:Transcript_4318/g.12069  ORF Transcript_4318/g.12069 Transcript_4318/m.12069 type:complete len:598 (+) Transcript_4318:67-1860(+)
MYTGGARPTGVRAWPTVQAANTDDSYRENRTIRKGAIRKFAKQEGAQYSLLAQMGLGDHSKFDQPSSTTRSAPSYRGQDARVGGFGLLAVVSGKSATPPAHLNAPSSGSGATTSQGGMSAGQGPSTGAAAAGTAAGSGGSGSSSSGPCAQYLPNFGPKAGTCRKCSKTKEDHNRQFQSTVQCAKYLAGFGANAGKCRICKRTKVDHEAPSPATPGPTTPGPSGSQSCDSTKDPPKGEPEEKSGPGVETQDPSKSEAEEGTTPKAGETEGAAAPKTSETDEIAPPQQSGAEDRAGPATSKSEEGAVSGKSEPEEVPPRTTEEGAGVSSTFYTCASCKTVNEKEDGLFCMECGTKHSPEIDSPPAEGTTKAADGSAEPCEAAGGAGKSQSSVASETASPTDEAVLRGTDAPLGGTGTQLGDATEGAVEGKEATEEPQSDAAAGSQDAAEAPPSESAGKQEAAEEDTPASVGKSEAKATAEPLLSSPAAAGTQATSSEPPITSPQPAVSSAPPVAEASVSACSKFRPGFGAHYGSCRTCKGTKEDHNPGMSTLSSSPSSKPVVSTATAAGGPVFTCSKFRPGFGAYVNTCRTCKMSKDAH